MGVNLYNNEGYPDPTAYEALTNIEKEKRQKIVFICSPFAGDVGGNTMRARRYGRFAVFQNAIPIIPHLMYPQILEEDDPEERILGLEMGLVLLTKCHELWVFGNHLSSGMAAEVKKAKERNIRIRYFSNECREKIKFLTQWGGCLMKSKEYIVYLLRNYKEIVATINMLKLELQNFEGMTSEEAIETLAFRKTVGESVKSSGISDKTGRMALVYREYAKRVNHESKAEVTNSLAPLESEIKMLETAVEGLSYQECDIIKELYFKNKSISQVAGEHSTSERSIRYARDAAINRLNSIYGRYQKITFGGTKNEHA